MKPCCMESQNYICSDPDNIYKDQATGDHDNEMLTTFYACCMYTLIILLSPFGEELGQH